jgi:hypothetical protein
MTEYNVRRFAPGSLLEQRADAASSPARAELVAALARQDPAFNHDGKSDAYLQGRLDAIKREARPFERDETEVREDADQSFTVEDIRAASHAQTRDAWKGNAQPTATPGTTWDRTPGGTFMARA